MWQCQLGTNLVYAQTTDSNDSDDESCETCNQSDEVFTGNAESGTYTDSPFFSILDTPQQAVSRYFENFVRRTDEFFANEKTSYITTGSYARVYLDTVWSEGGEFAYGGNLSVKLRLPATQGKLKLLVESDPEETRAVLDRGVQATPQEAVDQKKYYAGFLANFGRKTEWQFEPSLGVHIGSPLEGFVRLRAFKQYAYPDWVITINNTAYWFTSTGTGNDTTLEFNYDLTKNLLARATSFARWTHETDYFTLSQVFSLIHTWSERRAITYAAGVYGISEPTVYATDYLVSVRYRQALRKQNLFLELAPEVRFRQIYHFMNEYSFLVRLEWIFQENK